MKNPLIMQREMIDSPLSPLQAQTQILLPARQPVQHLPGNPQNDPPGSGMFSFYEMIFMENISSDEQEIPFFQKIGHIIHQTGKFPVQDVDDLIKIMIVQGCRPGGGAIFFINLIILADHVLPFILPAHETGPDRRHFFSFFPPQKRCRRPFLFSLPS